MKQKLLLKSLLLLCILVGGASNAWGDTYEQLTSIANIDESAEYVLGIDGTGFHYEGTSSWGKTALPSAQTPIKYTLIKAQDGKSFTAQATISSTTYYLQVPTSNTFSMATSTGTNTDLIIGTTQVSGTNYAVANKNTTARHLRINGTSGLRSYAGTTGTMAFFYKVVPETPAYTITAQSNNENYGTVSLTGSVITGSPKSGYRYASPAYTVNPANSATVAQDGNAFTVTPSANTTVTINFEAIPTHTAHFSVNGTIDNGNDCTVMEGANITFPSDPANINGKKFMGWVTATIDGTTDDEPKFVTSATMSTNDVTYYAVFASVNGESGWIETALADITASDIFVFSNGSYAMTNNNGTTNPPSASSITVESSKITSDVDDNLKWKVAGNSTDGYVFYPNGSTTTWLYCTTTASSGSNNNIRVGTGDRKLWVFDNSSYLVTNDQSTDRYLSLYGSQDFRGYINTDNGAFVPKFYKYSSGTITGYCTSVGAAVAVTGVTLEPTSKALFVGDEFDLTATVAPVNATDKSVTWTSSDETKATVVNGHVTALAAGTPTITVTTTDGSFTATCDLTISNVAVTGVSLNKDAATIYTGSVGNTIQLTPTIAPANATIKTVSWESDKTSVATIDENGLVTAVAEGTATITVTTTDGSFTATCDITVEVAPGSAEKPYTIAQAREAIDADEGTTDVYVKGIVSQVDSYSDSKYITYWISDDGTTTNQFEVYKGLGIDGASFTAVTDVKVGDKVVVKGDITKYYSTYEFSKDNQLVSIATLDFAFGEDSYEVECGGDLTVTASSSNSSGAITYSSSATDVAEINASTGVVTAKKEGETTITATIAAADGFPGKSIDVTLTVTDSREAATISFATASDYALDEDGTYTQLATVAQGDYNGTISYVIESTTSDGALIDDATGELLFDKKGTIVVKATAGATAKYKSNTATYTLKVRTTPTIVVANQSIAYDEIYTYDVASNVEGGTVTITSSNENVVEVDEYDMEGVAVGTSTITVSTAANDEYIAGSETFVLTVTAPAGNTTAPSSEKTYSFDFTDNTDWEFPSGSSNKTTASNTYTADGQTITLAGGGSGNGYYFNTSGYLMLGKSGATLTLPAFDKDVTMIDVHMTSGTSGSVSVNVYVGETAVSTATTGGNKKSFEINKDYQAAGNIYSIKVTNGYNAQVEGLTIHHYQAPTATITVPASGFGTYCSEYPLDFSKSYTGLKAWYVSNVAKDGSDVKVTFSQVTKAIKGGQGILLAGTPGTHTVDMANSSEVLSDNKLVGVMTPTYIETFSGDNTIFGLKNGEFVKADAGVIGANKAYLPIATSLFTAEARVIMAFDDDETTGISAMHNSQCIMHNEVFDLQGRKVTNPKKGLYIVNGKKVMIK